VTAWKTVQLGDVCTLQRGMDLPKRLRHDGEFPLVTSSGIDGTHSVGPVKGPGVITGRYGTIGKVFFVEQDFWPLNTTLYVRDFHGNDARFVHYLLQTVNFQSHSGKSGVPGVNRNDVHQEFVQIPAARAEQERIAQSLLDADALIDSLEQLLTKKRQIKQGAMQELFNPANLRARQVSLEQISGFITKGATPTTYGFGWESDGIVFLRSECVSPSGLDLTQSMFISEKAHTALRRSAVSVGDLLMTITGNVGRVAIATIECNINQHIARIRISDAEVNPDFVCHQLSRVEVREELESITTGQAYPQLSLRQVRERTVQVPSRAEQDRIAETLSDMDCEIATLESRVTKARALKQAMAQALLTGRIRMPLSTQEPTA
jgi:type I restriction enzyme, S subunit